MDKKNTTTEHEKLIQLKERWELMARRHGRLECRNPQDPAYYNLHMAAKRTFTACAKNLGKIITNNRI
jgi:hypothetical protein